MVTPHVAVKEKAGSGLVDGRTLRHSVYIISQRIWKRIEEIFVWGKTIGLLRKLVYRGLKLVNWVFILKMGVYNLVRMKNLGVAAG
jgi:hypothetical protein